MIFQDCQISNPSDFTSWDVAQEANCSRGILDWIADNTVLKANVIESSINLGGNTFYRFSISARNTAEKEYHGLGRSKNRLTAASIAAGEVIERFIAKQILKSSEVIRATHCVIIENSEISVKPVSNNIELPSTGLHSSNGWAVHFSLKSAIDNSVTEAMERHILLYTYLREGWSGFHADAQVPFKNQVLTPYISKFSFGGIGAGIVATEGKEFPGRTFGYLCDDLEKINRSSKWLSAFFESFDQWESLAQNHSEPSENGWLTRYQHHFLNLKHSERNEAAKQGLNFPKVQANILMFDIQKILNLPFPLFAAYTYGGDLIPLFIKQKLSDEESSGVVKLLKKWDLPGTLPEYHPIL